MTKGLVYYTDNRGDAGILDAARAQVCHSAQVCALDCVVAVSLKPVPAFANNIVLPLTRGYQTMFTQILAGLEFCDTDVVYFAEHDVLYHPTHFAFTPTRDDTVYYNEHVYKLDATTGRALRYWCNQTSGLCAFRAVLRQHYARRVQLVAAHGFTRRMGFEPGTKDTRHGGVDDLRCASWRAPFPNVDIRHRHNLTASRWRKEQFRNQKYTRGWLETDCIPGWGHAQGVAAGLRLTSAVGVAYG